jgi:hypothetical protein
MSDTTASLRRKISSAGDLQSVVRTMKALAASSIGQYEKSVHALGDYYRTVELGLSACFRESEPAASKAERKGHPDATAIGAVVFGSDQGLVGQFNDIVADYAIKTLAALPGKPKVWAVGERVQARLADAGVQLMGLFAVPNSVRAITPLIGQIQIESEAHRAEGDYAQLYVFHNSSEVWRALRASQPAAIATRRAMATRSGQNPLADEELARGHVRRHRHPCAHSSANTFSSHSSGRAPNPSRARTRAASPRCSAPTRTSTTCWKRFTAPFTVCARAASTRNYST